MVERIKIKNGEVKNFDIDKSIAIMKIGYTLNSEGTGYENAIIIRDYDDNDIITDNPEEIMRFMILLAEQQGVTLDKIFEYNSVTQLHGNDKKRLNDLIARMHYLDYLYKKKKINKSIIVLLAFFSLFPFGIISISSLKDKQILSVLIGIINAFFVGKVFADTKNISTNEEQMRLNYDILKFTEDLLGQDTYSR